MPPPDDIADQTPDDGVTRIAIPKPFREWTSPLVFVAIAANMATAGYLRGQPFFQIASEVEKYLFGAVCLLATSLPFAAIYGIWRLRRRRLLKAPKAWGAEVSEQEAIERLFRRVSAAEVRRRSRVLCEWLQARGALNYTLAICWHDEVAEVSAVRTPFEPRPLEAPDTLPVDPIPAQVDFPDASPVLQAPQEGIEVRPRSQRAVTFIGMFMIAAAVLWVMTQLARALQHRWMTGMIFPLTITVLVAIGMWGLRGLLNRDRWFLAPGAVVLRKGKGLGAGVDVRIFERRGSVACVFELAEWAWLLTLLSGNEIAQRTVTQNELMHFLRTWMSPLPPPVARFVDFE